MRRSMATLSAFLLAAGFAPAQETTPSSSLEVEGDLIVLSPFEVSASESTGYLATTSLAGTRINTELRDVGSAISVVTSEFLRDTAATDSKTLLQYTTNTEVGSLQGNFVGARSGVQDEGGTFTTPNTNTRVRGLTSADNTRNFFMSDIPWDGYNVDRVDMQRGPNSILFGMGSPAGIINTSTKTAQFRNMNELELRYGSYGSNRAVLDINRELIDNELAVRLVLLRNDEKYRQKPAHSLDKRVFGTARWEPDFLNRNGIRTTLKTYAEFGEVRSNNPRVITPIDYVNPWFNNMNKATYNPRTVQDNNAHYLPTLDAQGRQDIYYPEGYGAASRTRAVPGGYADYPGVGGNNPYYNPWVGNFAQSFGGMLGFFQPGTTTPGKVELSEFALIRGINTAGAIDGGLALPYSRRVSVDNYVQYAADAGLEWSQWGLYKNPTLTDASIFDFYNNLLDGDLKKEWQDFDNFNISLSQTYFDQKVGFEVAYDRLNYSAGQLQLITDQKAGIFIDLNTHGLDGTANPNLGRPFISDSGIYGNNRRDVDREASRLNLFVDHDFDEKNTGNWMLKLLGRHTLSGMYMRDSFKQDGRSFMRWGTDSDYARYVSTNPNLNIDENIRTINPVVYLGDSLMNRSGAAGAYIPRASTTIDMPSSVNMWNFNSTWNATGVDPAASWTNPLNGQISTQSENPDNYVGWTNTPVRILSAEKGDEKALTTGATLQKKTSESRALVLQSYFWDGAVVGMYGIRQDRIKSWQMNASETRGAVNFDSYRLPDLPQQTYEVNSPSWSIVAKLDKLVGGRIPLVDINFYYNKSQNFQVSGTRNDVYGNPLPLPSGSTIDRGILIATKDGKYSLKVNKYESSVKDASSTAGLNTWFLGGFMSWGSNYADVFTHNLGVTGDMSTANDPSRSWHYTYDPIVVNGQMQTAEQAEAFKQQAVAGWRALQAAVPAAYYSAWNFTNINAVQNHTYNAPANLTLTEDTVSKGYEFEFTANPTPNWRITANAAKVQAVRNNVGGAAIIELVEIVNNAMLGAAGDLRIWSGGAGNAIRNSWNGNFYSDYSRTRLSEGNASPELRKWRFNVISSYDFTEGLLKGVTAGVGYRWQDKIAIGYRPEHTNQAGIITFDLANPYFGPSEDAVDFWVGYRRQLTDKIDWRIQLNVRDAFSGKGLIPLTTQPDGTVAAWRIAPSRTWQITNTFSF